MHTNKIRGFSLAEMIVALFIVSIGVAITSIAVKTTVTTRDSANESIAFHIAASKLEELRFLGYDALTSSGSFSDTELSSLPNGAASTTVTTWNTKTKQAVAGVSWLGTNNLTRYVSLTTLITQVGGL